MKKLILLISLLLLCSACVSRTIYGADNADGGKKEVIKEKKLIWVWDKEWSE